MKQFISIVYLYIFLCLVTSCTHHFVDKHSYGTQVHPTHNEIDYETEKFTSTSWSSLINNSMQAITQGYDGQMQVRIPNLSESFHEEPLFVVDRRQMGKGFMSISSIDPDRVSRIQVLSRPNQIATYGQQGRHGVILIKMSQQEF